MSENSIIIACFRGPIVGYPPIQNTLIILSKLGHEVHIFSQDDNENLISMFNQCHINFHYGKANSQNAACRFFRKNVFLKDVVRLLEENKNKRIIFLFFDEMTAFIYKKLLKKYPYILQLLELDQNKISYKHLLLGMYDKKDFFKNAAAISQCEYNRAKIFEAWYNLRHVYVLPNKTSELKICSDSCEKMNEVSELITKIKNKKLILFQGYMDKTTRNLDAFCESIRLLPEEFELLLMGKENEYVKYLKNKYHDFDRIHFLPFIAPPHHLSITRLAYIGIIVNHAIDQKNGRDVLNLLYCAPNKLYEYSKFLLPVICNDSPSLRYEYTVHRAGYILENGYTPEDIAAGIKEIDRCYQNYSNEAGILYNSIDVTGVIQEMIETALAKKSGEDDSGRFDRNESGGRS